MNLIGDASFDMYFRSEETKPLRLTLTYDQIITHISRENVSISPGTIKCFCWGDSVEPTPVPVEKMCVTECLISSLNIANAENILSLTYNCLTEKQALSEVSLKAFFAFLVNATGCVAEKHRVQNMVDEQLRLHPSCAEHMVPRYRALMLTKDEEFANLTALEYIVSRLEQSVSVHNDVRISDTRTSRRRRRPARMADVSPPKRVKTVNVYVDSDEEELSSMASMAATEMTTLTNSDSTTKKGAEMLPLLEALGFLLAILRHDLGYMLKRHQPVRKCILAQLMFTVGSDDVGVALNSSFFAKICEIFKNCEAPAVVRSMVELLELVGDVCALLECDYSAADDMDVAHLTPCCRALVSEFCASVFGDKPSATRALVIVANLRPEWWRYHVSHYLVEKIFCRRVSFGVKGAANLFSSICRNVRRTLDTSKVLKSVNHNQLINTGTSGNDLKKSAKIEHDFITTPFVSKTSSLNTTEISSNIECEDRDDKYIDFNVRQKLSSIACKLLIVYLDSTIKIVKLTGTRDCENATVNFSRLKNTLNELCGEKNIPAEFNMLRRQLNKIFDL